MPKEFSSTNAENLGPNPTVSVAEIAATSPAVSAETADWSREKPRKLWDPSRRLLAAIRGYQRNRKRGSWATACRKFWVLQHRFWSVITQAEIDLNCEIGGGLLIPHPNGIVIHPAVKIGPNCLIFQQVTIGSRKGKGVPVIGGHVDIGAGAKILGDIVLHDHSAVGANAVVTSDVPPRTTVVGMPARPLVNSNKIAR
jgi:serine O-acetyltransferase